jgi:hypothetical protein
MVGGHTDRVLNQARFDDRWMCNTAQPAAAGSRTVRNNMELEHTKPAIAAAWIVAAGVAGFVANITSVTAWVVLAALGFGPPLIMLLLWRNPPQTISESIQEARR